MPTAYWLAFRIAASDDGEGRYRSVLAAVHDMAAGEVWSELGSFLVFQSEQNLEQVAGRLKAALDPALDIALVGQPNFRLATALGAIENQSLFELMPGTKRI
jgi:hypothetical protein